MKPKTNLAISIPIIAKKYSIASKEKAWFCIGKIREPVPENGFSYAKTANGRRAYVLKTST